MMVHLRFVPPTAKAAGLLEQLLGFHGLEVSSAPLAAAAPTVSSPYLLALGRESRRSDAEAPQAAWTMIMDPDPESGPPEGVLEFTRDGVAELVRRIRASGSSAGTDERRQNGSDRRTWDLRRFRFGLWLEFSRVTGAGKFDAYPLTTSKKMKTREALLPEVQKYRYAHGSAEAVLSEALDLVWDRFEDRFPSAVHVVDAAAESIWSSSAPQMLDRRHSAAGN